MIQFVRRISVLLKLQKARSVQRAFYFDLNVKFQGTEKPDPATGFCLSLPEVDQFLSVAGAELQQQVIEVSDGGQASEVLMAIHKIFQKLCPPTLVIGSFNVSNNLEVWHWQAPWDLQKQTEARTTVLPLADDEFVIDTQTFVKTGLSIKDGFHKELLQLSKDQPDLHIDGLMAEILKLGNKWGLALQEVHVHSRRQKLGLKHILKS